MREPKRRGRNASYYNANMRFIAALNQGEGVNAATRAAGLSLQGMLYRRARDADLAELWVGALAFRRARAARCPPLAVPHTPTASAQDAAGEPSTAVVVVAGDGDAADRRPALVEAGLFENAMRVLGLVAAEPVLRMSASDIVALLRHREARLARIPVPVEEEPTFDDVTEVIVERLAALDRERAAAG